MSALRGRCSTRSDLLFRSEGAQGRGFQPLPLLCGRPLIMFRQTAAQKHTGVTSWCLHKWRNQVRVTRLVRVTTLKAPPRRWITAARVTAVAAGGSSQCQGRMRRRTGASHFLRRGMFSLAGWHTGFVLLCPHPPGVALQPDTIIHTLTRWLFAPLKNWRAHLQLTLFYCNSLLHQVIYIDIYT